jgi:DNA-binding transcriptional LysR family regulator
MHSDQDGLSGTSSRKPLETRQIRYFTAVAEELHFGRAAARLGIAQPALSGAIRALERQLEVELLTRSTRSVELTPAGEVLYAKCERILHEIIGAASLAREMGREGRSKITIGSIHPATISVLPRFLQAISRRFAGALFEVVNADTEALVKRVEQGTVDLAFVRPVEQSHGLKYREIGRDRYLLALQARHRLADQVEIRLENLAGQPIIARAKQGVSPTERYFSDLFARSGLHKQVAFRCNDTVSILSLVANGLGVGFVPGWTRGFADDAVVLRSVADVEYEIGLGIVWRRDEPSFHPEDMIELASRAFAVTAARNTPSPTGGA